jgi:hypothetical protein
MTNSHPSRLAIGDEAVAVSLAPQDDDCCVGAVARVARLEPSGMRVSTSHVDPNPDCASLYPGYACSLCHAIGALDVKFQVGGMLLFVGSAFAQQPTTMSIGTLSKACSSPSAAEQSGCAANLIGVAEILGSVGYSSRNPPQGLTKDAIEALSAVGICTPSALSGATFKKSFYHGREGTSSKSLDPQLKVHRRPFKKVGPAIERQLNCSNRANSKLRLGAVFVTESVASLWFLSKRDRWNGVYHCANSGNWART